MKVNTNGKELMNKQKQENWNQALMKRGVRVFEILSEMVEVMNVFVVKDYALKMV